VIVDLEPDETLVAYTDGVTERRGEHAMFDEADLASLIERHDLDADALAGLIDETVVGAFPTPLADDIAILVLRRIAPATGHARHAGHDAEPPAASCDTRVDR
jgi:serine phosphatase RsbU (regulator of sigma subunit)